MKNRRDFLRSGALMAGLAMIMPKELYSAQNTTTSINQAPVQKAITISIENREDKDLNVFLCNYKNRSYLEKYAIRNIAKKHSLPVDYIIHGYKQQQNIQYTGVDELLETMGNNPFIVKDMFVRANYPDQLKTTMIFWGLDHNSVQYLPFNDFFPGSHEQITGSTTIGVLSLGCKMTNQVMLAFEMKAGCSLSLTFIYDN